MQQGSFRFGDWLASPDDLTLTDATTTVRLEPRAMAVLEVLAARAPAVVSIDELMAGAWPGMVVSDSAVYRAVTLLRQSLGDNARSPAYIESISRKGYRLKVAADFAAGETVPADNPARPDPGYLVIAIQFGDGGPRDTTLGTAVARFLGWTADAFRVQLWPDNNTGADYVLNLHHVTGQDGHELTWDLLDCRSSTLLFASSDHQPVPDSSTALARLAEMIADEVCDRIRRHFSRQIIEASRPVEQMTYWELVLTSDQFTGMSNNNLQQREERLRRACRMYDLLAPAHAAYADLLSWRVLNGVSESPREDADRARDEANQAIEADRDSPYALARCGAVFARLGEYARGVELCRRAYDLAPSTATREALARSLCFAGEPAEAIELLNQILETMPPGRVFRYGKLVVPLVQAGRLDEALELSFRSVSNFPGDFYAWVVHCNLLMHVDRQDEAMAAWTEVQRLSPAQTLRNNIIGTNRTYGRNDEQIHRLTGGLSALAAQIEPG